MNVILESRYTLCYALDKEMVLPVNGRPVKD